MVSNDTWGIGCKMVYPRLTRDVEKVGILNVLCCCKGAFSNSLASSICRHKLHEKEEPRDRLRSDALY